MIYLFCVISLILEMMISTIIPNTGLFHPIFLLLTLIIIYPYFYHDLSGYLKCSAVCGLIYDVVCTNTLFLNAFLFFIIAYIIYKVNVYFSSSYINNLLITLLIIVLYRTLSYLILVVLGYKVFIVDNLLNSISSSIILNLIYVSILYLIFNLLVKKKIIFIN